MGTCPKVGLMYLTYTFNKASIYFPGKEECCIKNSSSCFLFFLLSNDYVPALHVRCWLPFTGLSLFAPHVCLSVCPLPPAALPPASCLTLLSGFVPTEHKLHK